MHARPQNLNAQSEFEFQIENSKTQSEVMYRGRLNFINPLSNIFKTPKQISQLSKVVSIGVPVEFSIKVADNEPLPEPSQVTSATATLPVPPPQIVASVGNGVLATSPGSMAAVGPAPILPAFPGPIFSGTSKLLSLFLRS